MINGMETLIELQEVQIAIRVQEECLNRVPRQIDQLQEQLKELEQELEQAQIGVEQIRKQRRLVEGEVELLKQKLSHFRNQQMAVKTNKEYQAILKEISLAEEEIRRNEDRILEEMLAVDEKQELVKDVEARLRERQAEVSAQRAELEAELRAAQTRVEELRAESERLTSLIPEELRVIYDRISAARKGLAMAAVLDGSCEVCHVRLRHQLTAELKINTEKLITCESCNRILYYPRVPIGEPSTSG